MVRYVKKKTKYANIGLSRRFLWSFVAYENLCEIVLKTFFLLLVLPLNSFFLQLHPVNHVWGQMNPLAQGRGLNLLHVRVEGLMVEKRPGDLTGEECWQGVCFSRTAGRRSACSSSFN